MTQDIIEEMMEEDLIGGPEVKLSEDVVCKVDPEHGPNQKGWWNQRWMPTPVCNDFNVACDHCITHTIKKMTRVETKLR